MAVIHTLLNTELIPQIDDLLDSVDATQPGALDGALFRAHDLGDTWARRCGTLCGDTTKAENLACLRHGLQRLLETQLVPERAEVIAEVIAGMAVRE